MMRARWFRHISKLSVIGLLLGVLWGCGGSSTTKVLYAVGLDSTGIGMFAVSDYGTLVYIFSVTAGIGSAPSAIAIDPAARFLYVLDSGGVAGAVSQFVLNRNTGNLIQATFSTTNGTTPVAGPIETGANPKSMAIDGTGSLVFVANHGSVDCTPTQTLFCPSVSVFCIDPIGGTLTEMKQLLPPPAGTLNCTQPFSLPSSTPPNCTPTNPVPCPLLTPGSPVALATIRNLLFVAMANAGSSSVATYTFDLTGSLAPKPQTTAPPTTLLAGMNPSAMVMHPSGQFLFVADSVANTVAAFSIGSSGQLTPVGAPVATGTNPVSIRVHPSGAFLYTANRDSNDISAFSIDSSGALKPVAGSPFAVGRPGPSYVTTDAGGLLFVAAAASPPLVSNTISVFVIDGSGALKEVVGSPFNSIVLSPVALASIN